MTPYRLTESASSRTSHDVLQADRKCFIQDVLQTNRKCPACDMHKCIERVERRRVFNSQKHSLLVYYSGVLTCMHSYWAIQ